MLGVCNATRVRVRLVAKGGFVTTTQLHVKKVKGLWSALTFKTAFYVLVTASILFQHHNTHPPKSISSKAPKDRARASDTFGILMNKFG